MNSRATSPFRHAASFLLLAVLVGGCAALLGADFDRPAAAADAGADAPIGLCNPGRANCGPMDQGCATNLTTDPEHCGACDKACAAEQVCGPKGCASNCSDALSRCDRSCVDLDADENHCGECGTKCPSSPNGVAVCAARQCSIKCKPGFQACSGGCIPDGAACAECNAATCPNGCCSGGTCQPGNLESACGKAGTACVACAGEGVCAGGACGLLAAGAQHTCATNGAGTLRCWGKNDDAQLGDGTIDDRPSPVSVGAAPAGLVRLSLGEHASCVVTANGAAWCWGYASFGAHGSIGWLGCKDGYSRLPCVVEGLSVDTSVLTTGINHTCAVVNGADFCWGWNDTGALGDGTKTSRTTPWPVTGLGSGVTTVTTGQYFSCAVVNGGARCWGTSHSGEIGNGTPDAGPIEALVSVPVTGLAAGVVSIQGAAEHACALNAVGGVLCWGENRSGQLGDGSNNPRGVPGPVEGLAVGVTQIAAHGSHTCALTKAGAVRCWGSNTFGKLGDGSIDDSNRPVQVSGLTSGVRAIAVGADHSCARLSTGEVRCWGGNQSGQLGIGSGPASRTPVAVIGL